MFDLFTRMSAWLLLLGGVAAGVYASYALAIGEVVVESRFAGRSAYLASLQPGPFYGFVAFYAVCALVFVLLGVLAKKKA